MMISRLTTSQERKRMRVQFWIECLSVSVTILGGMFVAATPLLLMMIFAIPDERERDVLRILIFSSFLTAFLLIGIAGILGNLYYYYDEQKQGFKFMVHCGSGPKDHYFGETLFTPDTPSPSKSSDSRTSHRNQLDHLMLHI